MSEFNADLANKFYCVVIDFVADRELKPQNKLRLLTAILDSIDFWLLYALSKEVSDKKISANITDPIGKILAYLSSGQSLETKIDKIDVKVSYEALFFLLIRSDRKEIEEFASKLPSAFPAKALTLSDLFRKLYSFEKKFLRGEPALFRYAMASWDRKADYYKECQSEVDQYISAIKKRPVISVLQDWKDSRKTYASNSNVMESLTKGFKRLEDRNNIRSLKLIKFLKDLDIKKIQVETHLQYTKAHGKGNSNRPPRYDGMDNVIFIGPPGTGKTYLAARESNNCKKTFVQFHPSYAYENFVQGERLIVLGKDRFSQVIDGPLMIAFRRATNTPLRTKALVEAMSEQNGIRLSLPPALLSKYEIPFDAVVAISLDGENGSWISCSRLSENKIVAPSDKLKNITQGEILEIQIRSSDWSEMRPEAIIIDEINRAEVAKVFGELLKAISEKDDHESKSDVYLQYSGDSFFWPGNLRIVATMNSADRSIGEMDLALKRRFKIVEVLPEPALFKRGQKFKYLEQLRELLLSTNDLDVLPERIKDSVEVIDTSIDDLMAFNNSIGEAFHLSGEKYKYLPSLSDSLSQLNAALLEEESLFNVRKKLIGHSYFLKFASRIAELITNFNGAGLLRSEECALEYTEAVKKEYDSLLKHEIRPQVESICMENDKLSDKIIETWLRSLKYVPPKVEKEANAESKAS